MTTQSDALVDRAILAMQAAIEISNKPRFPHRQESFTILAINAWELILKGKWLALNQDDEKSLYVYQKQRDVNGETISIVRKTRSGAPFTYSLDYLAKKLVEDKHLDTSAWKNIEIMLEFRDSAIHFYSESTVFKNSLYEIGAACVRNFAVVTQKWFERELSEFDLNLMPLSFVNLPSNVDGVVLSAVEENFLAFVEGIGGFESEPDSDCSVLVKVAFNFTRSNLDDAILVRNTSDPNAVPVYLTEEQIRDRYPWDFRQLTDRCRERYSDFKENSEYHQLRERIASDSRFGTIRYLDPGNSKSTKKQFYNANILREFDQHYEQRS